jgi:hypothetical protein
MKEGLGMMTAVRFIGDDSDGLHVIVKNASGAELRLTAVFAEEKAKIISIRIKPMKGEAAPGGEKQNPCAPASEKEVLREIQELVAH